MTKQAPTRERIPDTIASYLIPISKALESRDIDSAVLFRQAGIENPVSNDPMSRQPHKRIGEVFRLAVEATGDPRFGLYASRYMLPSHIHALGTALLASRSLMDLCLRIERFGSFLAKTVEFYVERGPRETRFSAHLRVPLRVEAQDMFWSFVLRFMRHLGSEDFNPTRVELTVADTAACRDAYEQFFRCPLSFGHDEFAFYFDTAILETKLPTGSVELAQLSDQVVKDYLAKMDKDDIISKVSSLLVAGLPNGEYSKEDAAKDLHMSPRTLQKRLVAAGTSWRELLDRTRFELARSYLESSRYTLSEITYMLGFNDTSSFSRAFKRWSGKPPGTYLD